MNKMLLKEKHRGLLKEEHHEHSRKNTVHPQGRTQRAHKNLPEEHQESAGSAP
jgi:hypothetical protein